MDARAGLEKYVTVRHNRPRLSQAPLMLYKATYENEEEAALAMLVLDASGALAVHAKGADVVAVVSRPLATGNLHASAMAIHQPLFEAGLEPKVAFVHPSARVPSLTWHTASLGHNWRPDESELKALTSLPAQLGKANEILPVPGHPRQAATVLHRARRTPTAVDRPPRRCLRALEPGTDRSFRGALGVRHGRGSRGQRRMV